MAADSATGGATLLPSSHMSQEQHTAATFPVADGSQPSASSDSRHVFPFLDLPAELRDEIYDYTLEDYRRPQRSDGPDVTIKSAAPLEMLQVSRQVNHECRARARVASSLLIADHERFHGINTIRAEACKLSPGFRETADVHFNLGICAGDVFLTQLAELAICHERYVSYFLQQLRSECKISFCINVQESHDIGPACKALEVGPWTKCKELKQLEVYLGPPLSEDQREGEDEGQDEDYAIRNLLDHSKHHKLVAKWSNDTMQVERIAEEEGSVDSSRN